MEGSFSLDPLPVTFLSQGSNTVNLFHLSLVTQVSQTSHPTQYPRQHFFLYLKFLLYHVSHTQLIASQIFPTEACLSRQPSRPNLRVPCFFPGTFSDSTFSALSLSVLPQSIPQRNLTYASSYVSWVLCLDPLPAFLGPLGPCYLALNPGASRPTTHEHFPSFGRKPTQRPTPR